ncbi:MAG: hypothetical protein ACPG52_11050 [Cognaticolwellia sp.]
MNNINLKTLAISVVAASLISNLAFANNDSNNALPEAEKPASIFSKLIMDYDTDKNNALSAKELANNEKLTKIFAQLDINGDRLINEQEFNQYLEKMKKSLS